MTEDMTKTETPKKKGNKSWVPPTGEVLSKERGYGYRWVAEDKIPAHLQEGWDLVRAKAGETTFVNGKDKVFGGVPLDTVVARKNTVLMRMEDDLVKQRNAYWDKRAQRQRQSIKSKADELAGVATHGDIQVNGKPVTTVID